MAQQAVCSCLLRDKAVEREYTPISSPDMSALATNGSLSDAAAPAPKRARSDKSVAVPSHASWYRPGKVHSVEKTALPEYFDGRSEWKTEEAYVSARDRLVETYRELPGSHLSVTESRKLVPIDVAAVIRLHQFLEHWGLINYNATSEAEAAQGPTLDGPTSSAMRANARAGVTRCCSAQG